MQSRQSTWPCRRALALNLSKHPGQIPGQYHICRHTPGDDCPRAYYGIPAYPHSWQEDGTAPEPNVVLDDDPFGYLPALDPSFRLKEMGGGIDLDDRPNQDVVANVHRIVVHNGTQGIHMDMVTDVDVLPQLQPRGGSMIGF